MSENPHALLTREIVSGLLKLPKPEQREFMRVAVEFLRRESFTDVTSIHDFILAEPSAVLTEDRRAQLLSQVAKAIRDNEPETLMPVET
jgi:hypothetical protein